jgi:pimeloyl-ACP methyl ester carboxylesterase
MDMRVPRLARPDELRGLTAPTLVVAADRDLSFPGVKLLARAPALFPALADRELVRDCAHCPPTTDAFRAWLAGRIGDFLLGEAATADPVIAIPA